MLLKTKTAIAVLGCFMDKMATNVFMLYGAHDIKEMYGMKNFNNCIKQLKKIVRINGLKYNNIVSIIENSIIDSTDIGIDPKIFLENYVKKKTQIENLALQNFLEMKESFLSTIIDKLKGKSQGHDDFGYQLMRFLKKKKVMIVFEENNYDVVKKELEYGSKSSEETLNRVFQSSHEVDDLRDTLMVKQIAKLGQKHPDKCFLIVRGGFHNKLSIYLRQSGFKVSDYKY